MSRLSPRWLGMALALALPAGCRGVRPDASVEGALQACCTKADGALKEFAGCRVTDGGCRRGETYWMRGSIACGPVDEAACDGGRCCRYRAVVERGEDGVETNPTGRLDLPAPEPAQPADEP